MTLGEGEAYDRGVAVEDDLEPSGEEISRRDLFGRWARGMSRAAVDLLDNVPGRVEGLVGPGPGELDLIRQIDDILGQPGDP